jgi:glycerophosphoryl diester phosphodiesterase
MKRPPLLERLRARRRPLAIAHRGGAAIAPENTLFAFEQAVRRHGVDMIELDVHVTRDGVLVVAHDDDVARCTDGEGTIASIDFATLHRLDAGHRFTTDGATHPFRGKGLTIPTLDEVLIALPDVLINLELKPSAGVAAASLVETLRARDALHRTCIGSEDDDVGAKLHTLAPDACHFYPRDALTGLVMGLKSGAPVPTDDRYRVLDMPLSYLDVRLVDRALVDAVAQIDRWVNVWTIDDEREMHTLLADGVGGIMTDRPDVLTRVLEESSASARR